MTEPGLIVHGIDAALRQIAGRVLCAVELHDWHVVRPHWQHACGQTRQACRRWHCRAIR